MRRALAAYGAALATLLVLDAAWLSTMVPHLYRPALGSLAAPVPALLPAALFYLLYAAGVVALAVLPARPGAFSGALWRGAALGLVAYGTYDLTNQATLRDWPVTITLIDMAWGVVLTATAAKAAAMLAARQGHRSL